MRTLCLDIETSPNTAQVWQLWNVNSISLAQLQESSELLCFSAKWLGEDEIFFYSDWEHGKTQMVAKAHWLLDNADAVLSYNGKAFDIPYLNKEFLLAGLSPPSPCQQIDLYTTVKKRFKFPSYKLDYVSRVMGFEGKVAHEGHALWVKVLSGDKDAMARMEAYNKQDVILLEQMYEKLRAWIPGHPNVHLMDGVGWCTTCGSHDVVERESSYTAMSRFQNYQCLACGTWIREAKRSGGSDWRGVAW